MKNWLIELKLLSLGKLKTNKSYEQQPRDLFGRKRRLFY
jgi:hypothetical protein